MGKTIRRKSKRDRKKLKRENRIRQNKRLTDNHLKVDSRNNHDSSYVE